MRFHTSWDMWLLLMLALAVFLLTGDAFLASLLPYLGAARGSVESAFWLDSVEGRKRYGPGLSRASFWFYLAAAAGRAEFAAFATLSILAVVKGATGVATSLEFVAQALCVLVLGQILTTVFGLIGARSALRSRVRVYVLPNLKAVCDSDLSAIPVAVDDEDEAVWNRARAVLPAAIYLPFTVPGLVLIYLALIAQPANIGLLAIGGLIAFLLPAVARPWHDDLTNRVVAYSMWDCWGRN